MGESILIALLAFVVASVLVVILLPLFGALAGKTLPLTLTTAAKAIGMLLFIALISGLLAGVYPAFILSAFKPARVIKGTLSGWCQKFVAPEWIGRRSVYCIDRIAHWNRSCF